METTKYPFYGGLPPHEAPSTSRDAALAIEPDANTLRNRVLRFIEANKLGVTDEEIVLALGMRQNTERPRRRELVLMGLIVTRSKRRTSSGRFAQVWTVR